MSCAVIDSGIGIPEQRRDRLFKAFSQVDASTTRHYGGTGLGLAICARLCDAMGGGINVESVVGCGSTFRFSLVFERGGQVIKPVPKLNQAVDLVMAHAYDVILMDVQMPVLDGIAAAREIRNLALPLQPRIIALTANAYARDRELCLAAGMDDFLSKPFRLEELRDKLQHVAARPAG
jgi:CheY-like chemotaxis protein